jgi:hypothetical protein
MDPPSGLLGIVSGGEARDGGERTFSGSLLTRFLRCIVLSMCSNSREKLEIDLLYVRGSEAYNEPFENTVFLPCRTHGGSEGDDEGAHW